MISCNIVNLQERMIGDMVAASLGEKDTLTFKAPTGSGKTYMMASMIDRILEREPDSVFLVSALSKSGLARQNSSKFEEYIEAYGLGNMDVFSITPKVSGKNDGGTTLRIEPGHNVYVLPTGLCSANSVYVKSGELACFMRGLKDSPATVYCVKDESHINTNNLDRYRGCWDKTLYFSATPRLKKSERPEAEITKAEAEACGLIKRIEGDVRRSGSIDGNREELEASLCEALSMFAEVKRRYREARTGVNPAMLIQISNTKKESSEISLLENILKSEFRDLKYLVDTGDYHTSNDVKENLRLSDVTGNNSDIDVLVVKMKATEGFDIPRACMLYQVRNTKSRVLDEQIAGRVLRNPKLDGFDGLSEEARELVMKAWIWGDYDKHEKDVERVRLRGEEPPGNEIARSIQVRTTRFKEGILLNDDGSANLSGLFSEKKAEWKGRENCESIFSLYGEYNSVMKAMPAGFASRIEGLTGSPEDWMAIAGNIESFKARYNECVRDYKNSVCLKGEAASLPFRSFFEKNEKYKRTVCKWVWEKVDGKECEYSFDSEAECRWLEFMTQSLTEGVAKQVSVHGEQVPLLARNFFGESEGIGFVYWMDGSSHTSYPDFLLVDVRGRIHLFETKSVNGSGGRRLDEAGYLRKIEALKEAYACAAELTGNYFYLPVMHGDDWLIYRYYVKEDGAVVNDFLGSKGELADWLRAICRN